jgi:hypothetical protein
VQDGDCSESAALNQPHKRNFWTVVARWGDISVEPLDFSSHALVYIVPANFTLLELRTHDCLIVLLPK